MGNRSTANSAILLGELGILSLDDEELLEKRKGIFPKLASRIRPIQELLDARSRLKLRLHNLSNAKFDSSQKEHLELLKQVRILV